MPLVTRESVAEKLGAYLRHDLSLAALVDWAELALMKNEFDPAHLTTIRNVIARIGAADVRTFGLVWEDWSNSSLSSATPLRSTSSLDSSLACGVTRWPEKAQCPGFWHPMPPVEVEN